MMLLCERLDLSAIVARHAHRQLHREAAAVSGRGREQERKRRSTTMPVRNARAEGDAHPSLTIRRILPEA